MLIFHASMKTFRWRQLITGFSSKKSLLLSLKEKLSSVQDNCELLETLLEQVDESLATISTTPEESDELDENIARVTVRKRKDIFVICKTYLWTFQELIQSLQAMSGKVEDVSNDFAFLSNQVNTASPSGVGQRVKSVVTDWKAQLRRGHEMMKELRAAQQKRSFENEFSQLDEFYQNLSKQASESGQYERALKCFIN